MGSNEGRVWVSLGGVGHVEMSEGFFGLTVMDENFHKATFRERYSSYEL